MHIHAVPTFTIEAYALFKIGKATGRQIGNLSQKVTDVAGKAMGYLTSCSLSLGATYLAHKSITALNATLLQYASEASLAATIPAGSSMLLVGVFAVSLAAGLYFAAQPRQFEFEPAS